MTLSHHWYWVVSWVKEFVGYMRFIHLLNRAYMLIYCDNYKSLVVGIICIEWLLQEVDLGCCAGEWVEETAVSRQGLPRLHFWLRRGARARCLRQGNHLSTTPTSILHLKYGYDVLCSLNFLSMTREKVMNLPRFIKNKSKIQSEGLSSREESELYQMYIMCVTKRVSKLRKKIKLNWI